MNAAERNLAAEVRAVEEVGFTVVRRIPTGTSVMATKFGHVVSARGRSIARERPRG